MTLNAFGLIINTITTITFIIFYEALIDKAQLTCRQR